MTVWGVLQDLKERRRIREKKVMDSLTIRHRELSPYVLYEQGVACDPLHGLEEEAGQRHSFTAVVSGYLLLERRQRVREGLIFYCLSQNQCLSSSTTCTLRKSLNSGWL